jgi:PII-like signaling protein
MKYQKESRVSLKIYCDNTDTFNSKPLWEYILDKAKELNIRGATVYKAVAGIGSNKSMHRFDILNLSNTMPLVIEIIESKDKIDDFLEKLDINIKDTFISMQDVEVLV